MKWNEGLNDPKIQDFSKIILRIVNFTPESLKFFKKVSIYMIVKKNSSRMYAKYIVWVSF